MGGNSTQRAPAFHVPVRGDESFQVLEVSKGYSGCSWHFHPEVQLCHVVSGAGDRVIGDRVRPIDEGEVILLGANLPHQWRYSPAQSGDVRAVVVHFNEGFLGAEFLQKPEVRDIRLLLSRAGQGLEAHGETRRKVGAALRCLSETSGFERALRLLSCLHELAESNELRPICSSVFQPVSTRLDTERLHRVVDHVQKNFHLPIDRDSAARMARMSPGGFSRFFKVHTGMTFQEFVSDVRVSHACVLLMEEDLSIADVAFRCGFSDISTFHRAFKKFRESSPREYRTRMRRLRD